jgi:hypothetical protein
MLKKAIAAVKEDEAKALEMFNKGLGGFRDRDLYLFCANASDGALTAHPTMTGEHLQDIKGKKGFPLGQEIMQKAEQGTIKSVTYWWPRLGTDTPLEKTTFYTKIGVVKQRFVDDDRKMPRLRLTAQGARIAASMRLSMIASEGASGR